MAQTPEKKVRPDILPSVTIRWPTGCDKLYVVITYDEDGPVEVFPYLGMSGQCNNCMLEGLTRSLTAGLRRGVPIATYIKELRGISCERPINFPKKNRALSCSDALASCLEKFVKEQLWKQGVTELFLEELRNDRNKRDDDDGFP